MDEEQVKKMIDESVKKATAFSTVKYGDTPTDALQLVPKKYVDNLSATIYSGFVNLNGTAGSLPTGWTSSTTGTGQYTVTHNLNSALYTCVAISSATVCFAVLNAINVNDVQLKFLNDTGSLTDCKFYFILIPF